MYCRGIDRRATITSRAKACMSEMGLTHRERLAESADEVLARSSAAQQPTHTCGPACTTLCSFMLRLDGAAVELGRDVALSAHNCGGNIRWPATVRPSRSFTSPCLVTPHTHREHLRTAWLTRERARNGPKTGMPQ